MPDSVEGAQNPSAPPGPLDGPTFEKDLDELERVVKELETGDLSLERSLELFEKGMKLSEACRAKLEQAETRVEILTRKGDRMQPEPFKPGTK